MIGNEVDEFERNIRKHLDRFQSPEKVKPPTPTASPTAFRGYDMVLAVRTSEQAIAEHAFPYRSDKLSEFEARLEAEKAARDAGWHYVAFYVSIERIER